MEDTSTGFLLAMLRQNQDQNAMRCLEGAVSEFNLFKKHRPIEGRKLSFLPGLFEELNKGRTDMARRKLSQAESEWSKHVYPFLQEYIRKPSVKTGSGVGSTKTAAIGNGANRGKASTGGGGYGDPHDGSGGGGGRGAGGGRGGGDGRGARGYSEGQRIGYEEGRGRVGVPGASFPSKNPQMTGSRDDSHTRQTQIEYSSGNYTPTRQEARAEKKAQEENYAKLQFSRQASQSLRANNPHIADLSDSNRPTKTAERFAEIYDNIWTDLFEEKVHAREPDRSAISELLDIVTKAYMFCKDHADRQIEQMALAIKQIMRFQPQQGNEPNATNRPSEATNMLIQYRKTLASDSIPALQQLFIQNNRPVPTMTPTLKRYMDQCVEVTWWMVVQDPQIHMVTDIREGDTLDTNIYRAYTQTGPAIAYLVWPALLLNEGGPVLCKGVAQGKR